MKTMKSMQTTKTTKHLRKIFVYLLAVLIIAASFSMASFAEEEGEQATAITMKMKKIEGTVKIADKNRKSVTAFNEMRLYNGYRVETQKKSYAWIDLDSSKLIKLDADSRTIVQKNGKELDIILEKGRLFFDVAEPLADDEKMNIRTSTTAIGIRGTCGWIEVVDKKETKVAILEGSVQVGVIDPVTREVKVGSVSGGDNVTCVVYDQKKPDEKCEIISDRFAEKDVPGFVAVDIANDKNLAEKIFEKTKTELDLRNLTKSEAQERLKTEQLFIEEKQAEKSSQQNNAGNTYESSAAPESPATPNPSPPSETIVDLDATKDLTVDEIQKHLENGKSVTVNGNFTVDKNLTVPSGRTLTFNSPVTVESGKSITVNGTIKADNTITGNVVLNMGGQAFAKTLGGSINNLTLNSSGFNIISDIRPVYIDGYRRYDYSAYKLDDATKTLTIAGSGDMKNFSFAAYTGIIDTPWYSNRLSIQNVEIKSGVTSIGSCAFRDCSSLESVKIPDSVAIIGDSAFKDCSSLESVKIPDSVTIIGDSAFEYCSKLASVIISTTSSLTEIGNRAFDSCSSLTSINIPDSVTIIDNSAFDGCSSLASVTISPTSSLTKIYDSAFKGCSSLTSIKIPDSVASIGDYAFEYCVKLESVNIPDKVTGIGDYAFEYCVKLESVNIPDKVTGIGDYAFKDCHSLASVTISTTSSLTEIGNRAFDSCRSLASVKIPDKVTSIGDSAFSGCSSLTDITYLGTRANFEIAVGNRDTGIVKSKVNFPNDTTTESPSIPESEESSEKSNAV